MGPSGGQRIVVAWGRDPEQPGCSGKTRVMPNVGDKGPAPTDTGYHYYRVHDDGSFWRWDHWPKGQSLITVKSLADTEICGTQREGLTFNETWNQGDALGGSAANHYNYLSMTREVTVGGAWVASAGYTCYLWGAGPPYNCSTTGSQAWEAWTNQ